jgi:hypothetical protein
MTSPKTNRATVRQGLLVGKKVADALTTLDTVCNAGAQSPDVQSSTSAKAALGDLQTALTAGHSSLTTKLNLAQAILAAAKALNLDFGVIKLKLRNYETAVNSIADGDASIINKAGLLSRGQKNPQSALGKVTVVHSKVGKHQAEAILTWPAAPGATSYVIEVNWTPGNPSGPWVQLMQGTGRRRIVKAPTPASQFLARVASVASDGTVSEWSDATLATTL